MEENFLGGKNADTTFRKLKYYCEKPKFNEIFVSNQKRNPEKIYLNRALELFKNNQVEEVYVCGLGICVSIAVKIALKVCDILSNVTICETNTTTVTHNDDYVNNETKEIERKTDRNSNLIRIKLTKKIN